MKRVIDIAVSLLALAVLWPVMLVVAVLVRTKLGSPVLFRQARPGLDGASFVMLKFRTMTSARDEDGYLLPDAQRLTAFGRFLRSTSLDELPELINVLRGDMSLVGPRPLLQEYLELYTPEQARRHDVRPGVTGLAQVSGRNELVWERRFDLDLWYIDHCSLWLDLKILALTVVRVFRRDGISQVNHVTVEPFRGAESHQASIEVSDQQLVSQGA